MGLIIICLVACFGSVGIFTLLDNKDFKKLSYQAEDTIKNLCCIVWICSIIILIILVALGLLINATNEADHAGVISERESLVYQLENKMYDFDTYDMSSVGGNVQAVVMSSSKKDLYDDVKEFNLRVQRCSIGENNFWIGWYWGNVYYDIEPIDLNQY